MNILKVAAGILALSAWVGASGDAQAQSSTTLHFTAMVVEVKDSGGVLQGAVYPGQTISGDFVLALASSDLSPQSKVGAYEFTSAPSGVSLRAGAVVFSSDPEHINLRLEVLNNVADGAKEVRDTFLLHSYNNLPILGGLPVDEISWQVDDFNSTATATADLPTDAPNLAKYRSIFGLVMAGRDPDDPTLNYLVRAKVTSISKQ